jgi:hypothetical protein
MLWPGPSFGLDGDFKNSASFELIVPFRPWIAGFGSAFGILARPLPDFAASARDAEDFAFRGGTFAEGLPFFSLLGAFFEDFSDLAACLVFLGISPKDSWFRFPRADRTLNRVDGKKGSGTYGVAQSRSSGSLEKFSFSRGIVGLRSNSGMGSRVVRIGVSERSNLTTPRSARRTGDARMSVGRRIILNAAGEANVTKKRQTGFGEEKSGTCE